MSENIKAGTAELNENIPVKCEATLETKCSFKGWNKYIF